VKTIMITGSRGFLGKWLVNKLLNMGKYNISLLSEDLTNPNLTFESPDILIHLAAKHPSDKDLNYEVNYESTKRVAKLCSNNTHFIFLSTDYVFKESNIKEYEEYSEKQPETIYGLSKSLAEDYLLENKEKSSIIRTSMLYGYYNDKRNNFMKFLMKNLNTNTKIELYTDVYTHPTHVDDLSNFIVDVVENKNYGIFHACSQEFVNRYELAQTFCEFNGYDSDLLIPITRENDETAKMPKNINLKPSKRFLQICKIPLHQGIKHNVKELGIYNES
tara:strand:- start:9065 stop:9889 length:825 start_codon:yes stop_codon:yes gene_type:complete